MSSISPDMKTYLESLFISLNKKIVTINTNMTHTMKDMKDDLKKDMKEMKEDIANIH